MSKKNGSADSVGQSLVDPLREIDLGRPFPMPGDDRADRVQDGVQPASRGSGRAGPTDALCAETDGNLAEALAEAEASRDGPSLLQRVVPSKSPLDAAGSQARRAAAAPGA